MSEFCYNTSQITGIIFGFIGFLIAGIIIGYKLKKQGDEE